MGLGHGLDEDGEPGVQLLQQILRLRDGVAPRLIGRVHPVGQILSPVRPATQERRQTKPNQTQINDLHTSHES